MPRLGGTGVVIRICGSDDRSARCAISAPRAALRCLPVLLDEILVQHVFRQEQTRKRTQTRKHTTKHSSKARGRCTRNLRFARASLEIASSCGKYAWRRKELACISTSRLSDETENIMLRAMDYLRSFTAVPLLALICVSAAPATEPLAGNAAIALTKLDLRVWSAKFPTSGSQIQRFGITQHVAAGGDMHPFSGEVVLGVAITGTVRLGSKRSLVRVVLVDDQHKEYLVYETYPLLASGSTLSLESVCRETCALPPIIPTNLKVELVDASFEIQTVVENRSAPKDRSRPEIAARMKPQMEQIKKEQDAQIVDVLNDHIKARGLRWTAGETSLSRLSFAERKVLIACSGAGLGTGPNTQGAEFYKGGIFVVESGSSTASVSPNDSSSPVES